MDNLYHLTDDELVKCYTDGCNEAFDVILYRHKDKLFNYITYHLQQFQDKADDVFQETFVKAIVTIKEGRYTMAGHLYAWLTRIAHNIIIDTFRAEAQLPILDGGINEQQLEGIAAITTNCHEELLINEQTLRDVKSLMQSLPSQQREVVEMRFYLNMSFKEIADATGVSINTSLGRMRYALQNMRRMADARGISLEIL